jgi:hypothetical protein
LSRSESGSVSGLRLLFCDSIACEAKRMSAVMVSCPIAAGCRARSWRWPASVNLPLWQVCSDQLQEFSREWTRK